MKTLLIALSSSYVHTLLAPRYLAANSPLPVDVYETNVNVDGNRTLSFIINERPDVIAFSCYIFNISYIKKLLPDIRKSLPDSKIILGGYEAAFNSEELISLCDFILKGEGDFAFGNLLSLIAENKITPPQILDSGTVKDLDSIKSPYTDEYLSLSGKNKIIYMETCRGCPFSCSYCMSANTLGVRSFSIERIFSDVEKVMSFSPKLVKFVDRTFNYDKRRAEKIFNFLIERYSASGTRFHFEMAPELFDESLFSVISRAPKGLFQFEIGVQSYKKETLEKVNRRADTEVIDAFLARLINMGNVHVHVDLIAGLPCESKSEFLQGFDRLFAIKPDCLQAGFLKILKGSRLSGCSDGFITENEPPYEVKSTPYMSESDLAELKKTVSMLDLYYNSGRFSKSIRFLTEKLPPHVVFRGLAEEYEDKNVVKSSFSSFAQCDLLFGYGKKVLSEKDAETLEMLIYEDFIAAGNLRKWHRHLSRR